MLARALVLLQMWIKRFQAISEHYVLIDALNISLIRTAKLRFDFRILFNFIFIFTVYSMWIVLILSIFKTDLSIRLDQDILKIAIVSFNDNIDTLQECHCSFLFHHAKLTVDKSF